MGFAGFANAGSAGSTRVCVRRQTTPRRIPRAANSFPRPWARRYPIWAWLSAPHTSRGIAGTRCRDSSFCTRMLPTWGPFPWVTTISWPSATRSARRTHVSSIRRRCAAASAGTPGGRSALPPIAMTSFDTDDLGRRPALFFEVYKKVRPWTRRLRTLPLGEPHTYLSSARIAASCESRGAPRFLPQRVPEVPKDALVPDHLSRPSRRHRRGTDPVHRERLGLPLLPVDPPPRVRRPVLARRTGHPSVRRE